MNAYTDPSLRRERKAKEQDRKLISIQVVTEATGMISQERTHRAKGKTVRDKDI